MALNEDEQIRAGIVTDLDGRQVISVDTVTVEGELTVANEVEVTNTVAIPVDVTNEAAIAVDAEIVNATPLDVAVTNETAIAVDAEVVNATPIDVAVTNDTPIDVSGTVTVDDSTPVDVAVTNATPIEVSVAGSPVNVLSAFDNVAAESTDSQLVAAVTDKKIRVLAVVTDPAGTASAVTFTSDDGVAGTDISAEFVAGIELSYNPQGWFETAVDEGLAVTTSAGSVTAVQVVYVEV